MPYTIVQAGTVLQLIDEDGNIATLTLPAGITLAPIVPRFAVMQRYIIMVNSPSRPITIDGNGVVRVLSPRPPGSQITLSAVAGGTLSGTYTVRQTFRIRDGNGNLIAESELGPVSTSQAVLTQWLRASGISLSPDDVTSIMLYRTTTGGSVYFPWIELDGNTQTTIQDDLSDASLGLFAAAVLGSAPDLAYIAEFRGRLWGVDKVRVDYLRYTEAGLMYAWPLDNEILIPREGADAEGITGLISRREVLGIGKRNLLRQVTGTNADDFRCVNLTENVGMEGQESLQVFRDTAFWLWKDGVYQWNAEGIKCLSDGEGGKGNVRSWFATNSYFNRDEFPNAFAMVDYTRNRYRLFLASAGQTTIDSWVDFDLVDRTWWGPHKTGAFTPSCTFVVPSATGVLQPMTGSASAFLYKDTDTRTDDASTAIDFDVDTKQHDAQAPNIDKAFLQTTVLEVAQPGGRMTVTPYVGELNSPAATQVRQVDLTRASQNIGRLGPGKVAKLNFRENTAGQDVELIGYEIDTHELGKRL